MWALCPLSEAIPLHPYKQLITRRSPRLWRKSRRRTAAHFAAEWRECLCECGPLQTLLSSSLLCTAKISQDPRLHYSTQTQGLQARGGSTFADGYKINMYEQGHGDPTRPIMLRIFYRRLLDGRHPGYIQHTRCYGTTGV